MIFGREPALILGALQALLALAIGLGVVELTPEQVALVLGAAAAIAAVIVRQVVTPVAAPTLPSGTAVKIEGTDTKTTI